VNAPENSLVFALAAGNGALMAFPSVDGAEAYCEAIDVEKGKWLFFSEDGSPLEARFRRPANGTFVLLRAVSGRWLQERLDQVRSVEGCDLTSLPEVVELLKINRGKRAAKGI
jgi:hypothetical protein